MHFNQCTGFSVPECDCQYNCDQTPVDTAEEYIACLETCNTNYSACVESCVPDASGVTTERSTCDAGCSTAEMDCESGCEDDFSSCTEACDDDPDCVNNCTTDELTCVTTCQNGYNTCEVTCAKNQQESLEEVYAHQFACQAVCCNGSEDAGSDKAILAAEYALTQCIADCQQTASNGVYTANGEVLDCDGSNLIYQPGAGNIVHDFTNFHLGVDETTDNCYTSWQVALYKLTLTQQECEYTCNLTFQNAAKICGPLTKCNQGCLVSYDSALADCFTTHIAATSDDNIAYQTCQNSALKQRWECDYGCCWQQNGRDAYTECYVQCYEDNLDCLVAAQSDCPLPDCTGLSEEACDEANTTYEDCITGKDQDCADQLTACTGACAKKDGKPVDVPCSACYSVVTESI